MSIGEFKARLLERRREFVLAVLLFLVSTASFALGYLVAGETNRAPIVIETCSKL